MDLDSMKYAELRSLAKQLGLKANMKADKLLKAIKQHYQQEKGDEEQEPGNDVDITAVQEDENSAQSSTSVFVNTRRGKGNGTKRKLTDAEPAPEVESEVQSLPGAEEGDCEAAAPSPPSGGISAKKRRVSSPKNPEKVDNDPPTEPPTKSAEKQKSTKTEATVHFNIGNAQSVAKGGRIPRYKGAQRNKGLKPVTPNFKKLHEAHFNKMESIDSYVQRKTKQMETLRSSVKELKALSDKTKQEQVDGKAHVQKAKAGRTSVFSPAPEKKAATEDKRRVTVLSANRAQSKPAEKEDAPFRPSVLSTRRINVRFSEATHDNEHKRSLVKTPARKSLGVISNTPQIPTDGRKSMNTVKTSTSSAIKTPATFVFTGNNTSTPGTQKKANFDLKASLSRPLSYKPHTGKLKPFADPTENAAANKSLISNSHQKNYKQHQVQTREGRRTKQTEDRKQKKANMMGARRGLVMM